MRRHLQIVGNGVAAAACARLLAERGIEYHHESFNRPGLAAILLGSQTQSLLSSVFGIQDLSLDCHGIRHRIVKWGISQSPIQLPHQGLVISEQRLLKSLWQIIPKSLDIDTIQKQLDENLFSVKTIHYAESISESLIFGDRTATVIEVAMRPHYDVHACAIESLTTGWLFLLPASENRATLISVSTFATLEEQLAQSLVIGNAIDSIIPVEKPASFSCAPRITLPLGNTSFLSCGSAAMSFDPVCGEGAGNALREAFLASAVIQAMLHNEPVPALIAHYSSRLLSGFQRHLELCREFYATGGNGEFWRSELAMLEVGISRIRQILATMPPGAYRLKGLLLERLAADV